MVPPYLYVNIFVNSVGGETNLNYDFSSNSGVHQQLSIQTKNGIGSSTVSIRAVSGDIAYLIQATSSDWQLSDVTCTSTDPKVIITPYTNGVKISSYFYSSATCTFTNTKIIKKNPVIIVPGILSSYLNENTSNTEVWPNGDKMAFSKSDEYLDELALDLLGQPDLSNPVMIPTDIFRNVKGTDYFDGLINQLKNNGYAENDNLFVFPYDWRLSIQDNVDNVYSPLLTSLKDKVDQVLAQTGAQKVDIVAHSMGGLLAKYYIEHYGQGKVDKFVDIATPHLGAPNTLKTLVFGDDMNIKFAGINLLNPLEIKKISQNSPAVYQLLPSANYFSASLPDYNYYVDDMDDYDNDGVKGKLSFEQGLDFLKNTGRNDLVMRTAVNIHNDLDNMNPADYGVKTYNIVGCGTPTIGKIFTLGKQSDTDEHYDIAYISGDGTVPVRSAEGISSLEKYYASKADHGTMPSTDGIKELVDSLLAGTQNNFDFVANPNISTTNAGCKLPNGTFLGFHSPVDLNIYDSAGNHTGPNANGDIEENIPNIAYDIIDGNKFAYLPDGGNYRIELQATGAGSFSSHIKKIEDGNVMSTSYFSDIPLAGLDTKAEVDINTPNPKITLDITGDGSNIETVNPSAVLAGDSLADTVVPETMVKIISPATTTADGSYESDVSLGFEATDTDSGILKTEYSLDNGGSYVEATGTVIISSLGTSTIYYRSIDKAGNIEAPKQFDLTIVPVEIIIPDDTGTTTATSTETETVTPVVASRSSGGHSSGGGEQNLEQITLVPEISLQNEPVLPAPVLLAVKPTANKTLIPAVATTTLVAPEAETPSSSIPLIATVATSAESKLKPFAVGIGILVLISVLVFINKKYIIST